MERHGAAWIGEVRRGRHGEAGMARWGETGRGQVRQGRHCLNKRSFYERREKVS